MLLLPFTSDYDQRFITQLGDTKYVFDARWNERNQAWNFDFTSDPDQQLLLAGVPMLIGQDVLAPYALGAGAIVLTDLSKKNTDPGPDDLADRVIGTWFSPAEVDLMRTALGPNAASLLATGGAVPTPAGGGGGGGGGAGGGGTVTNVTNVTQINNSFAVTGAAGSFAGMPEADDASGNEILIARFVQLPGLNPNPTLSLVAGLLARGNGTVKIYLGGLYEALGSVGVPTGTQIASQAVTAGGTDTAYQITASPTNPGGIAALKITMKSSAPATSVGVASFEGFVG